MKLLVISPKVAEESATYIAEMLECTYINPYEKKRRNFLDYDLVINYGFSRPIKTKRCLNNDVAVNIARDKIKCLNLLRDKIPCVMLSEDRKDAYSWIKQGRIVVARDKIKGDNGKGLHYCITKSDLDNCPDAKFFTRYIEHTNEYRVNVFRGKVISIYDKSHNNGLFKFTLIKGQEEHPQLQVFATQVWKETGLDWFGMDLLRTKKGNLFFLEVNSAPVLFPYTTKKLVKALKNKGILNDEKV